MRDCLGSNVRINLKLTEYKRRQCIVKKHVVYRKFGEFIDWAIDYQVLKKESALRSWHKYNKNQYVLLSCV